MAEAFGVSGDGAAAPAAGKALLAVASSWLAGLTAVVVLGEAVPAAAALAAEASASALAAAAVTGSAAAVPGNAVAAAVAAVAQH